MDKLELIWNEERGRYENAEGTIYAAILGDAVVIMEKQADGRWKQVAIKAKDGPLIWPG